jgi:hypothetical protein
MPLTRSFPIDQGFPTALDLRRLDAGLIVREGILADPTTVAVAGIAFGAGGFNVSARAFVAALKRGGAAYSLGYGVARLANDAAGAAWTIPAAPVSNSRIDLLWIRATDPAEGEATSGTDGPGGVARAVPIFGVSSGTAAPSPVAPALPAGAYLIATVTTPSGAASIAGSTIVQSYGFAQLSGGTAYARTLALLPSTAVEGDRAVVLATGAQYSRTGGAWLESAFSLRQTVRFTSSGTFTKASYPWLRAIRVLVVGGGGAGAGCGAFARSAGGGGGGGATSERFDSNIAAMPATVFVTVGAGGAPGAVNTSGGSGGTSAFELNTIVVAFGGNGGILPGQSAGEIGRGGRGGDGSAGDIVYTGQSGGLGSSAPVFAFGGTGGSSGFGIGGGGSQISPNDNGNAAVGFGGGGSGGSNSSSALARSGGAGAPGVVILELFS